MISHNNFININSIGLYRVLMIFAAVSAEKLPTGRHLEPILRGNMTYVDKTGYALEVINAEDRIVFYTRPPGFGKSLFVNMLQLIFKGNESRELFKGTEIYNSDYDWQKYTVLYFDFDVFNHERGKLADGLMRHIVDMEAEFQVRSRLTNFANEFRTLVQQIHLVSYEKVVILIDNYDAPVIKCLPNHTDVAAENLKVLEEFFGCLKSLDVYIRLAFITGVMTFQMNHLNQGTEDHWDVTLFENYTSIMGFTEDEVQTHFKKYYENKTEEETLLHEKAFGYRLSRDEESVYHPHSVVQYFKRDNTTDELKPAEYVISALKKYPHLLFTMQNITDADLVLSDIKTLSSLDIVPMLFRNGYLTIRNCTLEKKKKRSWYFYDLEFATPRIKNYFFNTVMEDILRENITVESGFSAIRHHVLAERNLSNFLQTTNEYLKRANYGGRDVRIYQNLIECLFRVAGMNAVWKQRLNETNLKRIDCIFELLKDQDADEALHMMVTKNHTLSISDDRFRGGVVMGLNFDSAHIAIDGSEVIWFDENNKKTGYEYYHNLVPSKITGKTILDVDYDDE